jgi:hypothetical protein
MGVLDMIINEGSLSNEMFNRYYELQLGSMLITIDDLDIEFHIEGGNKENANKAEITIYNLSDASKAKIKKDTAIQLKAGYRNDYGIIFYGKIDRVSEEKDGADVKTIIKALDETKSLFESAYITRTYPQGTPIATIVKDMFNAAAIPVAKIEDPSVTLQKTMTFHGTPYNNLKICLDIVNGDVLRQAKNQYGYMDPLLRRAVESQNYFTFYTKNNMGYFVRKQYQGQEVIVLSSETGLMEVTEHEEEAEIDYKIRCLLQWKASADSLIRLDSIKASGVFKVVDFSHVCKGEEFYSELGVKAV